MNEYISKEIDSFKSHLRGFKQKKSKIFATSSFQTYSLPMLHIISKIDNSIPVYFLNTGFHFPETISFKHLITRSLNLNVLDIASDIPKINQRNASNDFFYLSDPSYCCYLNKVLPIENLLRIHDVWISGVRKDQNANRSKMKFTGKSKYDVIRLHPMINWTSQMIWSYIEKYNLPKHPLEDHGYLTVGCEPCTSKFLDAEVELRSSRWEGMNKTECGLHTDLSK